MNSYHGYKVMFDNMLPACTPKLKIEATALFSNTVRLNMDKWLEEMFGYTEDPVFYFMDNTIVTHPSNKRFLDNVGKRL